MRLLVNAPASCDFQQHNLTRATNFYKAVLFVATSILALAMCVKRQERKRKREWVASGPAKRLQQGAYHNLIEEMRLRDVKIQRYKRTLSIRRSSIRNTGLSLPQKSG